MQPGGSVVASSVGVAPVLRVVPAAAVGFHGQPVLRPREVQTGAGGKLVLGLRRQQAGLAEHHPQRRLQHRFAARIAPAQHLPDAACTHLSPTSRRRSAQLTWRAGTRAECAVGDHNGLDQRQLDSAVQDGVDGRRDGDRTAARDGPDRRGARSARLASAGAGGAPSVRDVGLHAVRLHEQIEAPEDGCGTACRACALAESQQDLAHLGGVALVAPPAADEVFASHRARAVAVEPAPDPGETAGSDQRRQAAATQARGHQLGPGGHALLLVEDLLPRRHGRSVDRCPSAVAPLHRSVDAPPPVEEHRGRGRCASGLVLK